MKKGQDGRPSTATSSSTLHVRDNDMDFAVYGDGMAGPGAGGLSVAPTVGDLQPNFRPARFGGNADDRKMHVWKFGNLPYVAGAVGFGLNLRPYPPRSRELEHGVLEPANVITLELFRDRAVTTRDSWTYVETTESL